MFLRDQDEEVARGEAFFFVGGSRPGLNPGSEVTHLTAQSATAALGPLLARVSGGCGRPPLLAVFAKLAPLKACFAIDTGAAVNVLSEETYSALKRESRGNRYPLRPNNLHLMGVGAENLHILGVVRLPFSFGKTSPPLHLDFYELSQFALPCDGLIGLPSLESHGVLIDTEQRLIRYAGRKYRALAAPTRLASPWTQSAKPTVAPLAVAPTRDVAPQPSSSVPTWCSVNAVILGNHEIPHRFAMRIPVSLAAPIGTDVCFDGPSLVHALTFELTLATVREGNRIDALVVNNSGAPVRLRKGVLFTRALVYGASVSDTPLDLDFPSLSIGAVADVQLGGETQQPILDSHVTVADYPKLRARLLGTLNKYRDIIALSGEALGATTLTEHSIKLKPGARPVYIPAYRLPHSQGQVINDQI